MEFPDYDCQKVGFLRASSDNENFHDRALQKANSKQYVTNMKIDSNPKKTLFIGNLNRKTSEETIKKEFKHYGSINSIKMGKDIITNENKGYCFVEFKHFSDAYEGFKKSSDLFLENQKIIVDFERERMQKNWKPRRTGGGLGGKKNSGQMRFAPKLYKKIKKNRA